MSVHRPSLDDAYINGVFAPKEVLEQYAAARDAQHHNHDGHDWREYGVNQWRAARSAPDTSGGARHADAGRRTKAR